VFTAHYNFRWGHPEGQNGIQLMAVGLMESRQSSRTQGQVRFQTTSTEEVNIKVKDTIIQSSGDEGVQVSNKIRADGQAADCRGTVRSTKDQGDAGERRWCKEGKGPDPVRDYEVWKEQTM
jgi:hypothetical protein